MSELILEPYAVKQRWRMLGKDIKWEPLIGIYLETVAILCQKIGPCVIGHIKALALFPNGDYLQVSVVSPTLPAGIKGHVPADCTELVLTLNVIVYGFERNLLERIIYEATSLLTEEAKGKLIIEAI
jgi:hypothetical protein